MTGEFPKPLTFQNPYKWGSDWSSLVSPMVQATVSSQSHDTNMPGELVCRSPPRVERGVFLRERVSPHTERIR